MKVLSILFFSLLAQGCAFHNVPMWQYDMFDRPPGDREYPEEYVYGWQHGCETGASASANNVYSFRYDFKQDPEFLMSELYYAGWQAAFDHCRKYILQHNLRSLQRPRT